MKAMTNRIFDQLKSFFQSHPDLHLWIMQYGISHSVMLLSIHKGTYPYGVEVLCGGCEYFSGDVQGGPYTLEITRAYKETAKNELITIKDNKDKIMVVFSRLTLHRARGEYYSELFPEVTI